MTKVDDLWKEAHKLYRDGKYKESALSFLQASEVSLEFQDLSNWYKNGVWAVVSIFQSSQYSKAMQYLLRYYEEEPKDRPNYEAWILRKNFIDILLNTNPDYKKIIDLINELEELHEVVQVSESDIYCLKGELSYDRGEYREALNFFEFGWNKHNDNGYVKHIYAINIAELYIILGEISNAKDWIQSSVRTDEEDMQRIVLELSTELFILIFNNDKTDILINKFREYDDANTMIQSDSNIDDYYDIKTRVYLLYHDNQNPLDKSHIAYQAVLKSVKSLKDVNCQYNKRLLFVDFRLAVLRYYLGIELVDDLYYHKKQNLENIDSDIDKKYLTKLIKKVLMSIKNAKIYATKIDKKLECKKRQNEVLERYLRVKEICEKCINNNLLIDVDSL